MKNRKWIMLLATLLSVTLMLAACGGNGAEEAEAPAEEAGTTEEAAEATEEKGTIRIGKNNWAENVAVSNMWKILLEEKGYEVELHSADKAIVYLGVAEGDLDIGMEVWLPFTDAQYVEEYGDHFTVQDIWYEETGLGLVVPEYVDVDSITELNDNADLFNGQIIGIDPGSSLMQLTGEAVEAYDLDFDLVESSDPAMMADLGRAYSDEEPIVVTLWSPHWAFAEYDLKYLDDPEGLYGEPDDIVFITREGFEDDHAEVLQWMNTWRMDDDSLGALMGSIEEVGDPVEGASMWIEDNRDLINQWFE